MEKPSRPISVVIAEVEDFVKRFQSGEIVLTAEAKNLNATYDDGKNWRGKPRRKIKSYCDLLGYEIGLYQANKDVNPRGVWEEVYNLLDLIERARAYGVIRDTKQQASDYEGQIARLKEEIDKLRTLNTKLAEENKYLHSLLPDVKKGKTEVGDVTG